MDGGEDGDASQQKGQQKREVVGVIDGRDEHGQEKKGKDQPGPGGQDVNPPPVQTQGKITALPGQDQVPDEPWKGHDFLPARCSGNGHRVKNRGQIDARAVGRAQSVPGKTRENGLHVLGQHIVPSVQKGPGLGGPDQSLTGPW